MVMAIYPKFVNDTLTELVRPNRNHGKLKSHSRNSKRPHVMCAEAAIDRSVAELRNRGNVRAHLRTSIGHSDRLRL
jgi:hypothetical protein